MPSHVWLTGLCAMDRYVTSSALPPYCPTVYYNMKILKSGKILQFYDFLTVINLVNL